MRILLPIFCITIIAVSCSSDSNQTVTTEQEQVMSDISKRYTTDVSLGISKDLLRFSKPYDLEVSLQGRSIPADSLESIAQSVAIEFTPTLRKKDKYKSIIVKFISETPGNVGVGTELSYTIDLPIAK